MAPCRGPEWPVTVAPTAAPPVETAARNCLSIRLSICSGVMCGCLRRSERRWATTSGRCVSRIVSSTRMIVFEASMGCCSAMDVSSGSAPAYALRRSSWYGRSVASPRSVRPGVRQWIHGNRPGLCGRRHECHRASSRSSWTKKRVEDGDHNQLLALCEGPHPQVGHIRKARRGCLRQEVDAGARPEKFPICPECKKIYESMKDGGRRPRFGGLPEDGGNRWVARTQPVSDDRQLGDSVLPLLARLRDARCTAVLVGDGAAAHEVDLQCAAA